MIRLINLGLRFLLELAALGALGYWGAQHGSSTVLRVTFALLCPLAMIAVWGLFVAPKARFGGTRVQRLTLGLVVFLIAAAALVTSGYPELGWTFGALALVNTVVVYFTGPQPGETSPR